jgi:hypothetical protein
LGKKYINIKIIGYSMNEKNRNNFHKIFIYILDFLKIISDFFLIFPARKTIYLDICGIYLHFLALSRSVGIFSGFFRIFQAFF